MIIMDWFLGQHNPSNYFALTENLYYKNTPEGRAVQSKYGKILHASRPEPPHNHPRMPMSNRAKIFSPFAALRGYEDEIASEGRDHLKGNRIELSEEGKEVLNQKISQLWKGQKITIKYFTDGYYENVAGVLDAVDVINKELRIYTGFINDTGKELSTIIAFEDILEIGVNMTWTTTFAIPAATASLLRNCRSDARTAER